MDELNIGLAIDQRIGQDPGWLKREYPVLWMIAERMYCGIVDD